MEHLLKPNTSPLESSEVLDELGARKIAETSLSAGINEANIYKSDFDRWPVDKEEQVFYVKNYPESKRIALTIQLITADRNFLYSDDGIPKPLSLVCREISSIVKHEAFTQKQLDELFSGIINPITDLIVAEHKLGDIADKNKVSHLYSDLIRYTARFIRKQDFISQIKEKETLQNGLLSKATEIVNGLAAPIAIEDYRNRLGYGTVTKFENDDFRKRALLAANSIMLRRGILTKKIEHFNEVSPDLTTVESIIADIEFIERNYEEVLSGLAQVDGTMEPSSLNMDGSPKTEKLSRTTNTSDGSGVDKGVRSWNEMVRDLKSESAEIEPVPTVGYKSLNNNKSVLFEEEQETLRQSGFGHQVDEPETISDNAYRKLLKEDKSQSQFNPNHVEADKTLNVDNQASVEDDTELSTEVESKQTGWWSPEYRNRQLGVLNNVSDNPADLSAEVPSTGNDHSAAAVAEKIIDSDVSYEGSEEALALLLSKLQEDIQTLEVTDSASADLLNGFKEQIQQLSNSLNADSINGVQSVLRVKLTLLNSQPTANPDFAKILRNLNIELDKIKKSLTQNKSDISHLNTDSVPAVTEVGSIKLDDQDIDSLVKKMTRDKNNDELANAEERSPKSEPLRLEQYWLPDGVGADGVENMRLVSEEEYKQFKKSKKISVSIQAWLNAVDDYSKGKNSTDFNVDAVTNARRTLIAMQTEVGQNKPSFESRRLEELNKQLAGATFILQQQGIFLKAEPDENLLRQQSESRREFSSNEFKEAKILGLSIPEAGPEKVFGVRAFREALTLAMRRVNLDSNPQLRSQYEEVLAIVNSVPISGLTIEQVKKLKELSFAINNPESPFKFKSPKSPTEIVTVMEQEQTRPANAEVYTAKTGYSNRAAIFGAATGALIAAGLASVYGLKDNPLADAVKKTVESVKNSSESVKTDDSTVVVGDTFFTTNPATESNIANKEVAEEVIDDSSVPYVFEEQRGINGKTIDTVSEAVFDVWLRNKSVLKTEISQSRFMAGMWKMIDDLKQNPVAMKELTTAMRIESGDIDTVFEKTITAKNEINLRPFYEALVKYL